MSFLVNKLAEHAGEFVADKIKSALGVDDDEDKEGKKDKHDKDGGFLSIFHHDKKKEDKEDGHKGGLFSFGKDKKDKDDDKDSFFDKIFNKDDHDRDGKKVPKKSGFAGLFSEQEGEGSEDGATAGPPTYEPPQDMGEGDLDLMNDLMEVANETS